ncbi:hypothetical protein GCM10027521_28810 [Amycolatopsis cihanbeyliensis]
MDDLAGGVYTGVGSPGDNDGTRDRRTRGLPRQRLLENPLHRPPIGLPRPTREIGAVIADVEAQTNEPALPRSGSDGLVRWIYSRQESSSDVACDASKPAASAASALANHTSAMACS